MDTLHIDARKEDYRQWMIGQLQLWDSDIVLLKAAVERLEPDVRPKATGRLWEVERRHHQVFGKYGDLMLADDAQWDEKQIALDAAAERVQELLDGFTLQHA